MPWLWFSKSLTSITTSEHCECIRSKPSCCNLSALYCIGYLPRVFWWKQKIASCSQHLLWKMGCNINSYLYYSVLDRKKHLLEYAIILKINRNSVKHSRGIWRIYILNQIIIQHCVCSSKAKPSSYNY